MSSRLPMLARLALGLALLAVPHSAVAHGGGMPWIYVENEQVWPGEAFHVLVLDVAPFVTVRLEAEAGDTRAVLGEIEAGAQGHGEADVMLPVDFPYGYANLRGVAADGTELTAPLRVGNVPDVSAPVGPGLEPPAQSPAASLLGDPALWTLAAILGVLLLAFAWRWLRRSPSPAPVRRTAVGTNGVAAPATIQRRRRKRSAKG